MNFKKFIHHLFSPHCLECAQEEKDDKFCRSCETLQFQLEVERTRVNQLLDRIAGSNQIESPVDTTDLKPIQTGRRFVPFAVRQQMREEQDNKTLEVLQQRWREVHQPPPPTFDNLTSGQETTEKMEPTTELERELLEFDAMNPKLNSGSESDASEVIAN